MSEAFFSKTYAEARRRFRDAAAKAGATWNAYPIDDGDDLTVDVAVLGPDDAPAIVLSSGVHGVEGFFGSAVQLAVLQRLAEQERRLRYVLIHGVNPHGFANLRRFNEDNVDLNRNFLLDGEAYEGAPDGYTKLYGFLNPPSPPSRFEPFQLKAAWQIYKIGLPAMKESVATGQYEYPEGIFFGGKGPCRSTRLIAEHRDAWLGTSTRVLHVDLHTGLGPFGTYKLLLDETASSERYPWYVDAFGTECVEPTSEKDGVAYKVSGAFGPWMQEHFSSRDYYFVTAELGTYRVTRVLAAIRAENRAHHYASEGSSAYRWAKGQLLEHFCPASPAWRREVVEKGVEIVARGEAALSKAGRAPDGSRLGARLVPP